MKKMLAQARMIRLTAIASALLAAFGPVHAEEAAQAVERLTNPESTVQFGAGYVDQDNQRFGQYTGLREAGVYGIADLDLVRRLGETGTELRLTGRNLGLADGEARFEHRRQGDWGYFIEFGQTPDYSPYMVNTRLTGIGGTSQTVNGASSGQDVQLKTVRKTATIGFEKLLPAGFDVQVRFRNEDKDGSRLFGQGELGRINFLTEPIDSTTQQLEATVGYTGEALQLSGGYFGTSYNNHDTRLDVTGGIAGLTPLALPPGNESHQLFLSGGYSFTPATRATFKVAYSRATQDDAFIVPAASTVGRSALGARVDTTLVQAGLTARPLPKLSLRADLRYEDRDDKTPVAAYFTSPGSLATTNGENAPDSRTTTSGVLEAGYQLPMGFRVLGGIDMSQRDRSYPAVRSVSYRDQTDETAYRVELRRSLSETATGSLSYAHSERDGSDYLLNLLLNGSLGSNLVNPLNLADRQRDRIRLTLNWTPIEALSIQFMADDAQDDYSGRSLGPREGSANRYALDATYAFSEAWQASAWASWDETRSKQSSQDSAPFGALWSGDLSGSGDAYGVGVRGRLTSALDIGADFQYSHDTNEYRLQAITGAPLTSLPDTFYKLTSLKLFAKYELQPNAGVRVDYEYNRFSTDDWTWTSWTYSDGTRVTESPTQKVNYIGLSGYYRWW